MQVGRRLLFDSITGAIHSIPDRSGDVLPNPVIQGEIKVLEIPYGQDTDKFARAIEYHVDTTELVVVFDSLTPK